MLWAVGISRRQNVYRADIGLIFPQATVGRRRKYHVPDGVAASAETMLADAKWQKISWRRGTKGKLTCLFAARRVRVADGHKHRMAGGLVQAMPGEQEVWLVGERRTSGEQKYYLSNLPADTPLKTLAAAIKARWICEQAHQQLKEELGLDHFEGRSWPFDTLRRLAPTLPDGDDRLRFPPVPPPQSSGTEKKSHRAATTTEHAGRQASHPRPLRTTATPPMSPL